MNINLRCNSEHNLHLVKGENDIDLSALTRTGQAVTTIGLKSGDRTVYVEKEGFYQAIGAALQESYTALPITECIKAVKAHLETAESHSLEEVESSLRGISRRELALAASQIGKAMSAGISMATGHLPLKATTGATQVVFLAGAVLKQPIQRALFEERLITDLTNILCPGVTVALSPVRSLAPERYGFNRASLLPPKDRERLITFDVNPYFPENVLAGDSSRMLRSIERMNASYQAIQKVRLSDGTRILFRALLDGLDRGTYTLSTVVNNMSLNECLREWNQLGQAVAYHLNGLDKGEFKPVKTATVEGKTLTLKDLLEGLGTTYTPATIVDGLPLERHLEEPTGLGQALILLMAGNAPAEKLKYEFLPFFSDDAERDAYAACEKQKWDYTLPDGSTKKVSFAELHALYLLRKVNLIGQMLKNPGLATALNCELEFIPPTLMQQDYFIRPLVVQTTVAKPMIHNMMLYHTVEEKSLAKHVFAHLSEDAEIKALFTLDAQFMDLHDKNIGFVLKAPEEYAHLLNCRYDYTSASSKGFNNSFDGLLRDYLEGKVSDATPIRVTDANGMTTKVNIPLSEAANWPWEMVLFDLDLSFGEDNNLCTSYQKTNHYTPMRSHLLTSDWKDQEFKAETLKKIEEMDRKIPQALAYLARDDSPFLQKLNGEERNELNLLLKRPQYNFGNDFQKEQQPLEKLRDQFAADLAKDQNHKIWGRFPGKNYEERYKIAKQLFPRATLNQQNAYKERVERRQQLFKTHEQLKTLPDLERSEGRLAVLNFLKSTSLLTTYQKEGYMAVYEEICQPGGNLNNVHKRYSELVQELSSSQDLKVLRQDFLNLMREATKPTYFNIAKAMFPILADNYDQLVRRRGPYMAGVKVGFDSIEHSIKAAAREQPLPYPAERAIDSIKKKV